jgi:uncharacterized membrane protein YagU involved in acid resistance
MRTPLPTGVLSGLAATIPMTALMEALHRQLPQRERYPLPPREITQRLSRRAGVSHEMDEPQHQTLAIVSHFAYGAATGGLYAILADLLRPAVQDTPLPPPARGAAQGMAYGLLVWAASYLGLLPALGILAPATKHPPRRNALMIAAHLVWGATLGALVETLRGRARS